MREWPVALSAGEWLLVTHLGYVLASPPRVEWRVDGVPQPAYAGDGLARLHRCPAACRGMLRVEAADPAQVDVVVF